MGKRITVRHNSDGTRTRTTTYTHKTLLGNTKSETYKETLPARKSGCYIATAVYGSYDCPQVWTLRRFRDQKLAGTWYGRLFIHIYYAVSPFIVRLFGNTNVINKVFRRRLDRLVSKLQREGVADTPYNDKTW